MVFRRREKFGVYPKENLSEQSREPTTNWAHVTTPNLGKEPLDRLVGGECSHHYTIPVLPRELLNITYCKISYLIASTTF